MPALCSTFPTRSTSPSCRNSIIPAAPGTSAVLDAPPALPGLLVATGFCGHGFALGPIVGKVMLALAQGAETGFNLRAFRLSRFAEGDVKKPLSIW